ncbi:hypothetical protein HDU67_001306 [Dinochytrium kinnereticum]|nr:hypothetical protein HDU67_001306 [Dinochytrium kinnereticum]
MSPAKSGPMFWEGIGRTKDIAVAATEKDLSLKAMAVDIFPVCNPLMNGVKAVNESGTCRKIKGSPELNGLNAKSKVQRYGVFGQDFLEIIKQ